MISSIICYDDFVTGKASLRFAIIQPTLATSWPTIEHLSSEQKNGMP